MITILISIGSVFIVLLIVVLALIIYRIRREKVKKVIHPRRIDVVVTDLSEVSKKKEIDNSLASLMNNDVRPEFSVNDLVQSSIFDKPELAVGEAS